jgi:outer membrane protein OmpA-like peptidoglycan-associated protein
MVSDEILGHGPNREKFSPLGEPLFAQATNKRFLMRNTMIASALVTGLFVAMAGAASAEQPGPYVGLGVGANFLSDADLKGNGVSDKAEFNTGWAAIGTLGYAFDRNWRTELELGYRRNNVDSLSGGGGNAGHAGADSVMANVLYDFDTGSKWTPYLGVGAGAVRYQARGYQPTATTSLNDNDTNLAAQGIVGISYDVADNTQLFLDYRYLLSQDPSVTSSNGTGLKSEYETQTVLVGFRYSFGRPPAPAATRVQATPAPMPAPAPAPVAAAPGPQSFQIFFDFNKSDVRPDARPIIEQAANNARKGGVSRVSLTGYTDRAGSDAYNQRLSVRRAEAIKAEFVRLGFNPGDISVVGKGESDPLVPTADGVREPKNRRVEILL